MTKTPLPVNLNRRDIEQSLWEMADLMQGNSGKVSEIISLLLNETPLLFDRVSEAIRNSNRKAAASIVHRLKTRYGYIGLDVLMDLLSKWEQELATESDSDHSGMLQHFRQVNDQVMEVLKTSPYFFAGTIGPLNATLPRKRILVAEDDEVNAKMFELLISQSGYLVTVASNGSQAVSLALEQSPDLIFMDVHMPYFSGLDAICELRARGIKIPIIAVSASSRLDERKNSITAGADDFLTKPSKRETILDTIARYLQ